MMIEISTTYMFVLIICIIVGYEIGKKTYDILKKFLLTEIEG